MCEKCNWKVRYDELKLNVADYKKKQNEKLNSERERFQSQINVHKVELRSLTERLKTATALIKELEEYNELKDANDANNRKRRMLNDDIQQKMKQWREDAVQ